MPLAGPPGEPRGQPEVRDLHLNKGCYTSDSLIQNSECFGLVTRMSLVRRRLARVRSLCMMPWPCRYSRPETTWTRVQVEGWQGCRVVD